MLLQIFFSYRLQLLVQCNKKNVFTIALHYNENGVSFPRVSNSDKAITYSHIHVTILFGIA